MRVWLFRRVPGSATGGGFIGYSIPWGSYIIGIEADIAAKSGGSFSTQSNTHASPGGPTSETFTGALSQRWDGSVRARFGLPLYSTSMIYATGGVAFGQMSGSFAYNTAPLCVTTFVPALDVFVTTCNAGGGALSWSDTRAGVTGGAGMEWVYLRNIKLRVEYRYTDFGSFSKDVPLALTAGTCIASGCIANGNAHVDMRASFHTLRLGIGFGF